MANHDALLAARLEPVNHYVLEMVGDTRLGSKLGLKLAEQDYEKALKTPCCEEEQCQLHHKRGQRLRALKNYRLALQELNEALHLRISPERLLDRAAVLGHLGQLEAALTDCDSAAAIVNESTDSSGFYADIEGMVDQRSVIRMRGDLCFRAAKYREAYREYSRAEAMD